MQHNCSCSLSSAQIPEKLNPNDVRAKMTSSITIFGEFWSLQASPLLIVLASDLPNPSRNRSTTHFQNASDDWSDHTAREVSHYYFNDEPYESYGNMNVWMVCDGAGIDTDYVKRTGRCIAQDAYSWGFSFLILLTFCSYTILFALALILLQTDVYWNSIYDRYHQPHSIYTDVLYLAEELKAIFGSNVKDHLQSPTAFSKRVERYKQGLRLEVSELPPSRWQE